MPELKEKYEQITNQRKNILDEINILKEDETVKRFFELCEKDDELARHQARIYKQVKTEEYTFCDHIWICLQDDSYHDHAYNGCIKCGLDERAFELRSKYGDYGLTFDQKIMYDSMAYRPCRGGRFLEVYRCDFDLAKAIYTKLKETHPDIDDVEAIDYLTAALHNISKNKVSDERKRSRARRLSLDPDYKWKTIIF